MSNILASLVTTANTLAAYDQALAVTQNNVANASTPGYAKERVTMEATAFDPAYGLDGGVVAGSVQVLRDDYAENSVRSQTLQLGAAQQNVTSYTALQNVFDISGKSGIPSALNTLYNAFSAWAQSPSDTVARQTVLDSATDVARAFQQTDTALSKVASSTEKQIRDTVTQINTLASQIRDLNSKVMNDAAANSGLDAQMTATLEQLSQYVDFTTLKQSNGTVTVLMNGQTPLVVGDQQYQVSCSMYQPDAPPPTYSNAPALARITASDGTDITSDTTGGQLGALLNFRNSVLPTYIGNAYQPGDLNTMAKQFADRVNQILTGGEVSDGANPVNGTALFTYDTTNDTNVAQTLSLNPDIAVDQLAAIDPGPPAVANGIPLSLSGLSDPESADDEINGLSYSAFYGLMASRAGSALNAAQNDVDVQQSAVSQAKSLRDQTSGVSLDEEAMTLLQFQRTYEANSKLISVLSSITETLMNMIQ